MAKKKKNLFSVLKRLFISDTDKKEKRKSRWIFRLLKMKQRLPPLSAPEIPPHVLQNKESSESTTNLEAINPQVSHQDYAAIRIQAVFRGFLARKALRALKGVVKLQALIRGWAVRKQAINTLKCLQSIVNIQLEVCSNRSERNTCQDIKVDINSQKRWNDSTLTKEESNSIYISKQEAAIKRERIKEYYLNHRRSAETERDKVYGRRRYWLEQWVDAQLAKQDYLTNFDTNSSANPSNKDEVGGRNVNSRGHRKQRSIGNESSFPNSPVVPTYMAFTESAKAKARSTSSPRLRPVSFDVCSEITSPYKHKYSPISSVNSELTSRNWIGNHNGTSRSPGLKGSPGPVKSNTSIKDFHLLQGIHK